MRGFISLTAHPEGCAANVRSQIELARAGGQAGGGPTPGLGNVLVIGSSTGYGLSSLLCACFGYGADTLGVCLERPSTEEKVGSAGWYNLAEAHRLAAEEGRHLETVNGDAYSTVVKQQVIEALRERYGPLDLVVYSLASPRRDGPDGTRWESVLKPIGEPYTGKSIDLRSGAVVDASLEPATAEEIASTVKVMGGEDWADWIMVLREAGLLTEGARTVAYSYFGAPVTQQVYRDGTIGRAKAHLEATAARLHDELQTSCGGAAWVSVNKAVATQASAAIPGVTLYLSILIKLMKERGTHEGAIEQIVRLFHDHLRPGATPQTDGAGLIRLDDRELDPTVQAAVEQAWEQVTTDSLRTLSDFEGYQRDFEQLFGFSWPGVDYDASVEIHRTPI